MHVPLLSPLWIDLFHNGGQIKYSFVWMLISLISLAAMGTIQRNISTKVRAVGLIDINTNLLLTEREGRTGEYWPEVVAVRTKRREVRTKTTEGQYSTVRLEQARWVSGLLYGTLSLIVKCASGGLHLKMFVFSIYLWNFGKIPIFLASSDSFIVKNDIIHTFFSLFWLQILNLPASLQNQNTRIGPFPWKWSVQQNPDRGRTNQSTGICLRLALPYNNIM